MLWSFQVNSKVTQPSIHACIHFPPNSFPFRVPLTLSRVPCALVIHFKYGNEKYLFLKHQMLSVFQKLTIVIMGHIFWWNGEIRWGYYNKQVMENILHLKLSILYIMCGSNSEIHGKDLEFWTYWQKQMQSKFSKPWLLRM